MEDINENYPLDLHQFNDFKSLFKLLVESDPLFTGDLLKEAKLRLIPSTLSPAHVSFYKAGSARKMPLTFDIREARKNGSNIYNLGQLIESIERIHIEHAESWIFNIVKANPNSLLLNGHQNESLLVYFIREYIFNHGFSEQSVNSIIDMFYRSGYKIHFFDLFSITNSDPIISDEYAEQVTRIAKLLYAKYKGNINHVFDYSITKATNLVELSISNENYLLAKFWQNQGVPVKTNLSDEVLFPLFLEYDNNSPQTQALLSLLESGALTFKGRRYNETRLNKFLPQNNADEYYKRFENFTLLPQHKIQLMEEKSLRFAKRFLSLQSNDAAELPKECYEEYIKRTNIIFSEIHPDAYSESHFIMNVNEDVLEKIKRVKDDSVANDKEKFQIISMIDDRIAKEIIESMLLRRNVHGEERSFELDPWESLNEEDKAIIEKIFNASEREGYDGVIELLSELNSLDKELISSITLNLAIELNASPEQIKNILGDGGVPSFSIFSHVLYNENIELLEVLINHGTSVDSYALEGQPLLKLAAVNHSRKGFEFLLDAGADLELPIVGFDALDVALKRTNEGTDSYFYIEKLLERGKKIEESHRQVLRELVIKYPDRTKSLLDKYGINL
ncbi:hypothetical protein [Alteromonas sp. W364]|uniref:hypothetical protein n=1 Tax=Alteromonas sp. W364 TaxID=3075610 RepID=UPI002886ADA6|nr:hypothetical protein [Alteromonas sp. W364]MDT0629304.1 hypothetical protein [Alteromonas sp. W364]